MTDGVALYAAFLAEASAALAVVLTLPAMSLDEPAAFLDGATRGEMD